MYNTGITIGYKTFKTINIYQRGFVFQQDLNKSESAPSISVVWGVGPRCVMLFITKPSLPMYLRIILIFICVAVYIHGTHVE
jgi:hypothetical protein